MFKTIIIAFTLLIASAHIANGQMFDQAKLDERLANLKKPQKISKRALKTLTSIQELVKNENYDAALKSALEVDTKRFNTTDFVYYYQLTANIYQHLENRVKFREYSEKILELPDIGIPRYKVMLLAVGQLYYVEGNYDKALENFDLYLTYEKKPIISIYMMAVSANIAIEDYEKAARYLDLGETEHSRQVENYKKWELESYESKINQNNKMIADARKLLEELTSANETKLLE